MGSTSTTRVFVLGRDRSSASLSAACLADAAALRVIGHGEALPDGFPDSVESGVDVLLVHEKAAALDRVLDRTSDDADRPPGFPAVVVAGVPARGRDPGRYVRRGARAVSCLADSVEQLVTTVTEASRPHRAPRRPRRHEAEPGAAGAGARSDRGNPHRRGFERHRRRLAAIVEQSRDAIIGKSVDGTIVSWNPAAERMYGWSAEEAIGRPATMLVPPDQEEEYEQLLARASRDEVIEGREVVRVRKDGSRFPISLTLSPIRDEAGQLIGISGIDRDMSVRKQMEEHLEKLAFEDPLTGLFNRRALAPQAQRALALADRHGESLAVLYVDLVGFKQINDRLGHAAGDEVLVRVARRLEETGRGSDTVARVGGDEFVILLGEVDGEASARTASARFAERLREPVETGEGTVSVEARFGLALYPDHGRSFDELVSAADRAMGRLRGSRGTGGRASGEPGPSGGGAAVPRLALADASRLDDPLAGALGEHLRLHYQPVFPAGGGSVRGLEALVRWREPGGELLLPDRFLELVETRGELCDLDRWVAEAALEASAADPWIHGKRPEWVSVNLSLASLRDAGFCDWLAERAGERDPDRPRLVVEVAEEAAVRDPAVVRERLSRLRDGGVGVAIDDFGAGHSSLAELQGIPADRAKIAPSLLRSVGQRAEADRIARSVIDLAHALGLEVTAKGVERRRQCDWLRSSGADLLQGHFLGRPREQLPPRSRRGPPESRVAGVAARPLPARGRTFPGRPGAQ